ncbi:uncharacterized protein O3C94_016089 [Discoglossus pictus]
MTDPQCGFFSRPGEQELTPIVAMAPVPEDEDDEIFVTNIYNQNKSKDVEKGTGLHFIPPNTPEEKDNQVPGISSSKLGEEDEELFYQNILHLNRCEEEKRKLTSIKNVKDIENGPVTSIWNSLKVALKKKSEKPKEPPEQCNYSLSCLLLYEDEEPSMGMTESFTLLQEISLGPLAHTLPQSLFHWNKH